MKRYYFIYYSMRSGRHDARAYWNQLIDVTPMEFLLEMRKDEDKDSYWDTMIESSIEVTKEDFDKYYDNLS